MKTYKSITPILTACLIVAAALALRADDASTAAAKKVFNEYKDCVVGVNAIIKMSFNAEGGGDSPVNIPDREQKMESLGTVIEADGLVVTALSTLDPSREITGREIRTAKGTIKLEASATLKEVRVVMPDGTEIPAEIVLKDADLDLAFIKVKAGSKELKETTFKPVDLKNSAKVDVTDEIVSLGRTDESLFRQPTANRGTVSVITRKPRVFIRINSGTMGCPTFDLNGKLVGIAAMRTVKGKNSSIVVVPASDVQEIADQAKKARPPAETKSETKDK